MKKIKVLILFLLMCIPFLVQAETKNVEITKVEFAEKSDTVEELEEASFENLKINFNLKFSVKNDYAKYKVTFKNNSDKDYKVDGSSSFNDGEFIKYDYTIIGDTTVLKAKSEMSMYITITYFKDIDSNLFVNGKYVENNNVEIELSNGEEEVIDNGVMRFTTNPETSTSDIIKMVIFLGVLSAITFIVVYTKKGKVFIIVMLLAIPVLTYALEKIKIEVKTYIEIEEPVETKKFYIRERILDEFDQLVPVDPTEYRFEEGMTLGVWVASKYNTDNLEFDYNVGICSFGKKYLFADEATMRVSWNGGSLGEDHVLIENNVYIKGDSENCT